MICDKTHFFTAEQMIDRSKPLSRDDIIGSMKNSLTDIFIVFGTFPESYESYVSFIYVFVFQNVFF